MTIATTAITTAGTDVTKLWRKVQGDLSEGMNFLSDEYRFMEKIMPEEFKIDVSAREITVPIDLNEEYGVADIPEGGYEAIASSVSVEEVTLSYLLMNARFTASVTTRILDENQRGAELKRQIVFQGMKKMQALARHWSDYVYGYSTAILALTDTDLTTGPDTLTLKSGYGDSTIAGTDAASGDYIASKFKTGEKIAVLNAGTLVTGAIGTVGAITTGANPTMVVTWDGTPSTATNNLQIVKANSLDNTVNSYNRGLWGFLDVLKSTSVHSLSSSSVPNWSIAGSDTTGNRLSGIRLIKARDLIVNDSPYKPDRIVLSQGVKRDLISLQQAALRFNDPFALELDGDAKMKSFQFFTSKRVPPGYAIMYAGKAFRRLDVHPKPDGRFAWSDAQKMENRSGYIFGMDFITQNVVTARKAFYYFSGLTES